MKEVEQPAVLVRVHHWGLLWPGWILQSSQYIASTLFPIKTVCFYFLTALYSVALCRPLKKEEKSSIISKQFLLNGWWLVPLQKKRKKYTYSWSLKQ